MLTISSKLDKTIKTDIRTVRGIEFKDLEEHLKSIIILIVDNPSILFFIGRSKETLVSKILKLNQIIDNLLQDYMRRVLYHYCFEHNGNYFYISDIHTSDVMLFIGKITSTSKIEDFTKFVKSSEGLNIRMHLKALTSDYGLSKHDSIDLVLKDHPDKYIINSLESSIPTFNIRQIILNLPIYTSILDIFESTSVYKNIVETLYLEDLDDDEKKLLTEYLNKTQINTNLSTRVTDSREFNSSIHPMSNTLGTKVIEIKRAKYKRRSRMQPPLETTVSV